MTTPQTGAPTLQERLRDGESRFLKWAHKEQYSGPPVLSIPRHDGNIDALLEQAADALDARDATIAALVEALEEAERKLKDAANYWSELCNDGARAPFTVAAKQARAALAKAVALKWKNPRPD